MREREGALLLVSPALKQGWRSVCFRLQPAASACPENVAAAATDTAGASACARTILKNGHRHRNAICVRWKLVPFLFGGRAINTQIICILLNGGHFSWRSVPRTNRPRNAFLSVRHLYTNTQNPVGVTRTSWQHRIFERIFPSVYTYMPVRSPTRLDVTRLQNDCAEICQ